jgi:PST family polysaccharide transporter
MLSSGAMRAAVAFASNLVLVRFIAPEQFGEFALALAAIGMCETVVSLRVGIQVLRMRDDELDDDLARVYWTVLLYEVAVAGLLSALWLWLVGSLSLWSAVLIVGMLTQHWFAHTLSFFERQQPYRRLATLEGASALAAHGLAVALVLLGAGPAALYLRELALGAVLVGALAAIGGLRLERPRWLGLEDWRGVVRDVRGIWLEGVLEGTFQRACVLLVGAVGSTGSVGFFYQAHRLAMVPQQLLTPLTGRMALNWLSRDDDRAARRRLLRRLLGTLALPLAPLAVLCLVFADPVVPLLFGESWRPAAELLEWLIGVVAFFSLFAVMRSYLMAARQMRVVLIARLLQWSTLLLPLVPWLWGERIGVDRVAIGVSLSYAMAFGACLAFALRQPVAPPNG